MNTCLYCANLTNTKLCGYCENNNSKNGFGYCSLCFNIIWGYYIFNNTNKTCCYNCLDESFSSGWTINIEKKPGPN